MSLEYCESCNLDGNCSFQSQTKQIEACAINRHNREKNKALQEEEMKNAKIEPVKPLYRVLVKYTKDKEAIIMFFDEPVEVNYNFLCGSVTVDTIAKEGENRKCLFITHYGLIDYCQVSADMPIILPGKEKINMNFFKVIEYCESCDENGSCQYKKYPGKRESCAKHRHIKEKKELSSDEEFLNFMISNNLTLEQLESMYQKWRNFNYMTRKDIEHTLSEFETSNKINVFRELKDPEPVMLNTYIPTQYPVYIKWTDGTELLIYFNEPVYIRHDTVNKTMSVVNVNNKCLFMTHQNNVEYMHVGSQPPVYLAKHMNIPVEKEVLSEEIKSDCRTRFHNGPRCTYAGEITIDKHNICSGHTVNLVKVTEGKDCGYCTYNEKGDDLCKQCKEWSNFKPFDGSED